MPAAECRNRVVEFGRGLADFGNILFLYRQHSCRNGRQVMLLAPSPQTELPSAISKWFLVNGFVVAGWIAHIPRQKVALQTSPGPLGLALLCMAVGSIFGLIAAPRMIGRLGAGRAAWMAGFAFAFLVPFPLLAGSVP